MYLPEVLVQLMMSITVDSIASALELKLELNKDAVSKLKEYYFLELCTNDLDKKNKFAS